MRTNGTEKYVHLFINNRHACDCPLVLHVISWCLAGYLVLMRNNTNNSELCPQNWQHNPKCPQHRWKQVKGLPCFEHAQILETRRSPCWSAGIERSIHLMGPTHKHSFFGVPYPICFMFVHYYCYVWVFLYKLNWLKYSHWRPSYLHMVSTDQQGRRSCLYVQFDHILWTERELCSGQFCHCYNSR